MKKERSYNVRMKLLCGFYVVQTEVRGWLSTRWVSIDNETGTSLFYKADDAKKFLDEMIKGAKVAAGTYYEHANGELGLTIIK